MTRMHAGVSQVNNEAEKMIKYKYSSQCDFIHFYSFEPNS